MQSNKRKSIIIQIFNIILSLLIFVILLFILHFPTIISMIIVILFYIAFTLLLIPDSHMIIIGIKDPEKQKEYSQYLENSYRMVEELKTYTHNKSSAQIKELITKIEKILTYLQQHPSKIKESKKFFKYYLPTILKIIKTYDEISKQDIDSDEIEEILRKSESSFQTMDQVLDDIFTKILQNETLDLDLEINVLKNSIDVNELKEVK